MALKRELKKKSDYESIMRKEIAKKNRTISELKSNLEKKSREFNEAQISLKVLIYESTENYNKNLYVPFNLKSLSKGMKALEDELEEGKIKIKKLQEALVSPSMDKKSSVINRFSWILHGQTTENILICSPFFIKYKRVGDLKF